ncbi:MAG: isoprenylcysteine carboxylmethyltransferase family protein [Candidatus Promineifilaceae bacterium]|nr:isoprenylcysteine carboxylmethyltransferase family protein [Candidatus Promineifilaceae bacterium]
MTERNAPPFESRSRLLPSRSRLLFLILLLALAVQRLLEIRLSRRHEEALVAAGGQVHGEGQYRIMTALHTGWFVAMIAELLGRRPRFRPWLAALAAPLFLLGQALRYTAIRTLGERWTTTVVTLPGAPPVTRGIYSHVRHPNYVGVVLELAAFPLMHSLTWTAALFSLANLLLLRARIRLEEQVLARDSRYLSHLGDRPRFVPRAEGERQEGRHGD